jgi:beta-1,4-mannosyl-glycoprotein beta-1,4-N-acetylglucosaminyltransferase
LENKERFSPFLDKVIHHVFDPKEYPYPWYVENEQRNQLKEVEFDFKDGDIFLLSDADEIMKSESVAALKEMKELNSACTSIMQMSYGYINAVIQEPWHHKGWRGTVILPYKEFHNFSLNKWRDLKDTLPRYEDSGWHFSFMGGANRIKQKLESYAHSEFNNNAFTDINTINTRLNNLEDPLGRKDFSIKIEYDESKFPKSSLKFQQLFYK